MAVFINISTCKVKCVGSISFYRKSGNCLNYIVKRKIMLCTSLFSFSQAVTKVLFTQGSQHITSKEDTAPPNACV